MKHQIIRCLGVVLLLLSLNSFAQSVGIGTETPNSNAILELVAPNANQGLLVPRVSTAERTATTFTDNLSATDNGLLIYDEDEGKFYFWVINQWVEIASGNIDALPDQTGQNNRYLQTDGANAQWADIDFTTLSNIPAGLSDGDNDTQLSDADIAALGYIKNADDADSDPANEFQDLSLTGNTLSLTNSAINVDLTPFAGTNTDNQTLGLTGTDLSISGGNTLDVSSLVNDADFDPTNEDQTVSAGTGISVNQVGDDFEVTNTSPDQTVSLSNGGNVTVTGTYPNFTLTVPNNLDNDPTNEDQTVSAGTGISVNQVGDDFEVTNTSPDQTVSISNGGNVTVTGTYPNFTLAVPNNLDNDPTNEDQTVSAGTGISVNQVGDDFEVTNTSPDQTVSISNGGNVTVTGTYPNFTLAVPNNLDNDPTNEDQTVSAGTGISVNQVGDDFEVTNTSPDQTVSISNGGNVTVTGTYPNFTLAVPNNLDNDPTNEDQTVSAGTGISVNQVGDDFEVTNTSPDQTVSLSNGGNVTITGTYPNFTLSVPTNNDNSATNEIELPTQTAQNGNFLTTDGTNPSWASIAESQWNTNGTSINYTTGNVNIGAGTIPTSRLQLTTNNSSSTTPQLTIQESNSTSDASLYLNRSGTNIAMGIDATDGFFKISGANALGNNDRIIMDNLGTVGIGVTPNAQFHVQTNTIESTNARLLNTHASGGSKIGILNELDNQGTSLKTGLWNDISGTASNTSSLRGVFNEINPTDGIAYGVWTQIAAIGSGVRYGSYNDVRSLAGNAGNIYGFRAQMDNDGNGDSFGFQANMLGGTSTGRKYGIYTNGEDFNYFEGNVGIGDVESDVELTIQSFDIGSTLPLMRLNSGSGTSDAGISYSVPGGNEFIVGVDATDNAFKISDGAAQGSGVRMLIDVSGNVGINELSPSARLDVSGTTELNGTVDINSTLDVQDQLTVTNDIQIPAANNYTYASAVTKYKSIHPTAFKSMKSGGGDEDLVTPSAVDLYVYFQGGNGAQGLATAPLDLPDGASINGLEAWLLDNNNSSVTRVRIQRHAVGTSNSRETIATVETTTTFASSTVSNLSTTSTFNRIIDNQNYSYSVVFTGVDNASNTQLHGVRITYSISQVD